MQEPKNEFREQLAKEKSGEKERAEIERDAYVTYLFLKNQKELLEGDYAHIQSAIDKINKFCNEIYMLPNGKMRFDLLQEGKALIENLTKQRDMRVMNRRDAVLLAVLEEKFGGKNEEGKE